VQRAEECLLFLHRQHPRPCSAGCSMRCNHGRRSVGRTVGWQIEVLQSRNALCCKDLASLDGVLHLMNQVRPAAEAQVSLRIKARRMESHAVIAQVDCVAGSDALDGDPPGDNNVPLYAVFDSKSGLELDVGCIVSMQPPVHTVTLPCGARAVLCPEVAADPL
jgi:hypothetical protein